MLARYSILLIDDEVITGFGRTGEIWGAQACGMKPTTLTAANLDDAAVADTDDPITTGVGHDAALIDRVGDATHIGEVDKFEAEKVVWWPITDLRELIAKGAITSGTTVAALLYILSEPAVPA